MVKLAEKYGAHTVDLYNCGIPSEPQKFYMFMGGCAASSQCGMDAIANAFVSSLLKNSAYATNQTTYDITFELEDAVYLLLHTLFGAEAYPI